MVGRPTYLGFANLQLSKIFMYGTSSDDLQPFSDPNLERKMQLHYMDCDSFVLSIKTNDLIHDVGRLQKRFFYFSNLKKTHLLYDFERKFLEKSKLKHQIQ